MCQHCLYLAQVDCYHFISYCEHDLIHLSWGVATLHLPPQTFMRVVRIAEEGVTTVNFSTIRDQSHCQLVQFSNGHYELTIGNALIFLTSIEFLNFVRMVRQAAQAMKGQAAKKIREQVVLENYQQYQLEITPGDLFCTN